MKSEYILFSEEAQINGKERKEPRMLKELFLVKFYMH